MKFIPAIETDSIDDLKKQIDRLLPYFSYFSLDIQDGTFTSTTTYQIQKLLEAVPQWDLQNVKNIEFDFDLMTTKWQDQLPNLSALSEYLTIKNAFVHVQTLTDYSLLKISNLPFSIGLAFDTKDEIETSAHTVDLNTISAIQIMTIISGPQSQPIIPEMLNKIGILRQLNYRNKIIIDGGVHEESLQVILAQKNLPDFACVGSYLSHAGTDLERRIQYLKSIEEKTTAKEG